MGLNIRKHMTVHMAHAPLEFSSSLVARKDIHIYDDYHMLLTFMHTKDIITNKNTRVRKV